MGLPKPSNMSKHLFIILIPGSGSKKEGFSQKFQNDLKRLTKKTSLHDNYTIAECLPFNQSGIDSDQDAMFNRMKENNKLGGILSLRKAFLGIFGDAVIFESDSTNSESAYYRMHNYMKSFFENVNQQMISYDKSELVIVAGSMGIHVLSCYIWDANKGIRIFESDPATSANDLKNLRYLATVGCNVPIYLSYKQANDIVPISRPNAFFSWDNFYDKDDVLGWPLKPLCPAYDDLVTDYQINAGLYVGSHIHYWDDNNFTKPFTKKITDIYEGL